MATKEFNVGDRVQVTLFQHKGKMATVKYFGKAPKKFGLWVGLELDEPTGDKSGEVNGETLFECQENHALVLRNTQVKVHDGTNAPVEQKKPIVSTDHINTSLDTESRLRDSRNRGKTNLRFALGQPDRCRWPPCKYDAQQYRGQPEPTPKEDHA